MASADGLSAGNGAVNTDGADALVHFDYGTSSAYGASTLAQLLAPAAGGSTAVSAALAGLPVGIVIHHRVVAQTNFGTVDGTDSTVSTPRYRSEARASPTLR